MLSGRLGFDLESNCWHYLNSKIQQLDLINEADHYVHIDQLFVKLRYEIYRCDIL